MENQVSIIIEGVRYDAVGGKYCASDCDLYNLCEKMNYTDENGCNHEPFSSVCGYLANNLVFKKSDKKFEV